MRRTFHPAQPDSPSNRERRGIVLILTAVLLVTIFGFVTFSVDYGYMSMVHGGLQNAADAAALGAVSEMHGGEDAALTTAESLAAENPIGSQVPTLDVAFSEPGVYDRDTKTFLPTTEGPNAFRVRTELRNVPLYFAPILGHDYFDATAEAIAMAKPRELVFVVDLSGSMNDDTEAVWAPYAIQNHAASRGVSNPNVGFEMLETLYGDFGFGPFPGPSEEFGENLVDDEKWSYGLLTGDDSPLCQTKHGNTDSRLADFFDDNTQGGGNGPGRDSYYTFSTSSSENTRKLKAYRFVIDYQIRRLMPNALPFPDSTDQLAYRHYEKYLDYILPHMRWYHTWGARRKRNSGSTWVPYDHHWRRMEDLNPGSRFPGESKAMVDHHTNRVGYQTYVQWLSVVGRDQTPIHDYSIMPNQKPKVQLSLDSPYSRTHAEVVNGQSFQMPPRTYPMHACRRSVIRAIQMVKERNRNVSASTADRVGIVTFDALTRYHNPEVTVPLTADYDAAMLACTRLQAVGEGRSSTAAQPGISLGAEQLLRLDDGGAARPGTDRVLIFLTDGMPNLKTMSDGEVSTYAGLNPGGEWYSSGWQAKYNNAALAATHKLRADGGELFAVGMGLGMDEDFMNRMARINADDPNPVPRTAGDPAEYEERLVDILEDIVENAGVSLVQ